MHYKSGKLTTMSAIATKKCTPRVRKEEREGSGGRGMSLLKKEKRGTTEVRH